MPVSSPVPPPPSPHLPPPVTPTLGQQPAPGAPAAPTGAIMPQAGKPRRRWLRWTLIGVGGLLVVSAVGTALTEPTEDESQEIAESEQSAAPPVGNAPQDASDPDPAKVEPVEDPATGAAAALQCTAWDPPIAYSTSIGSCDESSVMGAALAHQVGLADSPESPCLLYTSDAADDN